MGRKNTRFEFLANLSIARMKENDVIGICVTEPLHSVTKEIIKVRDSSEFMKFQTDASLRQSIQIITRSSSISGLTNSGIDLYNARIIIPIRIIKTQTPLITV